MDRYLIETPHTEQNCRDLVDLVNAAGYLNHFDWGCMAGVHCGWAIIEAENEAAGAARCAASGSWPGARGQDRQIYSVDAEFESSTMTPTQTASRPLKLMAVLAHPDDESLGIGGTLAKYAGEGVETYLVTATRGERGRFGETEIAAA